MANSHHFVSISLIAVVWLWLVWRSFWFIRHGANGSASCCSSCFRVCSSEIKQSVNAFLPLFLSSKYSKQHREILFLMEIGCVTERERLSWNVARSIGYNKHLGDEDRNVALCQFLLVESIIYRSCSANRIKTALTTVIYCRNCYSITTKNIQFLELCPNKSCHGKYYGWSRLFVKMFGWEQNPNVKVLMSINSFLVFVKQFISNGL